MNAARLRLSSVRHCMPWFSSFADFKRPCWARLVKHRPESFGRDKADAAALLLAEVHQGAIAQRSRDFLYQSPTAGITWTLRFSHWTTRRPDRTTVRDWLRADSRRGSPHRLVIGAPFQAEDCGGAFATPYCFPQPQQWQSASTLESSAHAGSHP